MMGAFGPDIPGETPIDDISDLIPPLRTREELNRWEIWNIAKAITKYLSARPTKRTAPFDDYGWFLKLHKEMFCDVWRYAGRIRSTDLNIGVPAHSVSADLWGLTKDLACWQENWGDVYEIAAWLHHRAVYIHPFYNGNGRWARLLTNIWLMQRGHPIVQWPEANISAGTSPIRCRYLEALRSADGGDKSPLIQLHRELGQP
ncbi:MAG: mobile mystery protein B [Planctomycetota bacterium]